MNDRRIKLISRSLPFAVDQGIANQRQPINAGVERTKPVGELFGEHRHNRRREIDRCGSLLRIAVERCARTNVVTDVSNGHQEPPAFWCLLAVDSIIEVARIFTVDGHESEIREVHSVQKTSAIHLLGQFFRLSERIG